MNELSDENDELREALLKRKEELGNSFESLLVEHPSNLQNSGFVLGRGIFGSSFRVRKSDDGHVYAVKRVTLSYPMRDVSKNQLFRECEILMNLTHRHIVRIYEHFLSQDEQWFSIVVELVEGGTLHGEIDCHSAPNEADVMRWAQQMSAALSYMHERNVYHGDLNPGNVKLTASNDVKIIGLQLHCAVDAQFLGSKVGTQLYASYEKMEGIAYDGRDDVWAAGCILLEVITRKR
jgi:serine/threonine protein kinase